MMKNAFYLTIFSKDFLGVRFEVGEGGGGTPCQICYDQARNLKFGTYVHTHMQFQKIYLLASKPS